MCGHVSPFLSVSARSTVQRPSMCKSWTDESMTKALEAVTKNKMSVREAAARFNVPKSNLGDRVSGRVQHGTVSGPKKYLTLEEESELTRFLIQCAGIGYPKTRHDVSNSVCRYWLP